MNDIKTIREKVRSLHVLLVDDEDLILEGTSAFLRKFFDQVDTAKNGEIGLEKFKNDGPYDIVLSDIQMPKMSGDKLIEAIKKINTTVFTAIMSGSPGLDKDLGLCDIYLTKPITIDSMMKILNMIIAKKNL
jgi:YesN/AraC family two-component response regulator